MEIFKNRTCAGSHFHSECDVLFLQGLIFVVDSNDRERAQEAAEELQKMVRTLKTALVLSVDLRRSEH